MLVAGASLVVGVYSAGAASAEQNPASGPLYITAIGSLITSLVIAGGFILTLRNQREARLTAVNAAIAAATSAAIAAATTQAAKEHSEEVERLVIAGNAVAGRVETAVTTLNAKSIANLADDDETRRISALSEKDRTADDWAHLASIARRIASGGDGAPPASPDAV